MTTDRRDLLRALGAGLLLAGTPARLVLAAGDRRPPDDRRLVLVLLRGGLDGLSASPAWGDPHFERARAGIAVPPPGEPDGALALDGFFGLHPALAGLHRRWQQKELVVVHAHCTPYRERSHFDAQNVLEHGGSSPWSIDSGWLNRALAALPVAGGSAPAPRGLAIGHTVPLALRGEAPVGAWAPSVLPSPQDELLERIETLYGDDDRLAAAFGEARYANRLTTSGMNRGEASGMTKAEANGMDGGEAGAPLGRNGSFPTLCRTAGRLLAADDGPRIATLEVGGWDSHSGQERPMGGLHRAFHALDAGLDALRGELGPHWHRTVVVVLTEFGRTVAMNGSGGTDHGTGGAGFLVGGAVRGGQVVADWPGLAAGQLHEGRDLRATLDTRALLKGVLEEHLGIPRRRLDDDVFPDSQRVAALPGLIRESPS